MARLNQFLATGMLVSMLILFSLGAPASPAHGATLDRIRAEKVINAGFRNDFPFSYKSDDGHVVGYSQMIFRQIVKEIEAQLAIEDLRIQYVDVAGGVLPAEQLKAGLIDIECGSTQNTAENRLQMSFSAPIFLYGFDEFEIGCVFRRDDPEFRKVVNRAVSRYISSAEGERVFYKYFMADVPVPLLANRK